MVELGNVVCFTSPAQVGVGLVFRQNISLRFGKLCPINMTSDSSHLNHLLTLTYRSYCQEHCMLSSLLQSNTSSELVWVFISQRYHTLEPQDRPLPLMSTASVWTGTLPCGLFITRQKTFRVSHCKQVNIKHERRFETSLQLSHAVIACLVLSSLMLAFTYPLFIIYYAVFIGY